MTKIRIHLTSGHYIDIDQFTENQTIESYLSVLKESMRNEKLITIILDNNQMMIDAVHIVGIETLDDCNHSNFIMSRF